MTTTNSQNKDNSKISPDLLESIRKLRSPELVQESLLLSTRNLLFPKICVSRSLNWNRLQDCSLYQSDFEEQDGLPYVIGYDVRAVVFVWLKVGATMEDELQAYVHALLLQKILSNDAQGGIGKSEKDSSANLLRRCVLTVFERE